MESSILSFESKPPITDIFKQETTLVTERSSKDIKPTISFDKKSTSVASDRTQKITDLHINHLCRNGRLKEAVAAVDSIANRGSKVRPRTYISLLQSCINSDSIELGRELHARIGLVSELNPFVETKLISMYAKCGSLEDALQVFSEMSERNLFTWSAMIGAYSREQRWRECLNLFLWMMGEGTIPDEFLLPMILQACANLGDVETGKLVHSVAVRCGMNSCVRVNNSILAMYAKCGRLSSARRLFDDMDERDCVTWNSIISGYCRSGDNEEAMRLFQRMQADGIKPGLITWNILLANYNQSGNCDIAMELMNKMENSGITPDVFTWTSLISGFVQNSRENQALEMFREMMLTGVEPNGVTIASAVSACSSLKALKKGMELQSIGFKTGAAADVLVGNSLIVMYSQCGKLEDAQLVFDKILEKDVFTWNSMIGGYAQAGYCGKAYDLFMKMQDSNVHPNVVTWNVMITGYMQNGDADQAMDLFQRMKAVGTIGQNTASWNSIIAGFLRNGQKSKALGIFRQMQSFHVRANSITILSVLPACANLIAANKVKEIHGSVLRNNLISKLAVANSLIDTYSKSGNIVCARTMFDGLSSKDIISWNSLIAGYVLHGCSEIALDIFDQMRGVGLKPNRGTFVSIIVAYGLNGMVDEGKEMFSSMLEDYHIKPGLEHYSAMVDLFGRSGRLSEATKFIEEMTIEPDSTVWAALLTACRVHGNIGLAAHAAERLIELEPGNFTVYRLMLQIHALGHSSENASKIRKTKSGNGTLSSLGCSWIEMKNIVHAFVAGDKSNPNLELLYSKLESITEDFKAVTLDSHDTWICIEEEDKIGGVHSEKLAIAFAIFSSYYASQSIRIVKNLRMCRDCHRTAKLISLFYEREIYLSDTRCLHHFKNGQCSCKDYW